MPEKPTPTLTRIGGKPVREWIGPEGEEYVAFAPDVLAISRELRAEGLEDESLTFVAPLVSERRRQYLRGERDPSPELVEDMAKIDREQRGNGYRGV